MAKRAHIVTMDEARATAQVSRQQSATKQRALGFPKKGGLKKGVRSPGVRKLGQSPRAQEAAAPAQPTNVVPMGAVRSADRRPAPAAFATPGVAAPARRDSRPMGQRRSQPVGARGSQPFAVAAPPRTQRAPREVFRFDEDAERAAEQARASAAEPPEGQAAQRKPGLVGRLTERFGSKRRAAAKTRASRSFDRQYGGSSVPAAVEAGGPRAAVYQGQMGTKHRQAARSLASGALGAATAVASAATGSRARKEREGRFSMRVIVPAVVMACLVATCVFMYGPVQLWYQEMRENDRLHVEYAALQERNAALQSDVDSLSSEAGIEDRVHQQYGWVREDEHAVSVSGLSSTNDIDFIANVSPGSVTAPETWYSAFLDPLFGVS